MGFIDLPPTVSLDPASNAYPEGYHLGDSGGLSAVDTDLVASKIKDGVAIFGVLGTFAPTVTLDPASNAYPGGYHAGDPGGLSAVDTDLVAGKIKDGVTIFGVTGTFAPTVTLDPASNAYPQGYHAGNAGGLSAVDVDLIAANIKWGTTIFGVLGTLIRWTYDLGYPALPALPISIFSVAGSTALVSETPGTFDASLTIPAVTHAVTTELSYIVVEDCEDAWNEYVAAGVTSGIDTVDYKLGTASVILTIDAAAAVGRMATEAMGATDLSPYRYLKLWVKSSIAIALNDLSIMLDDTPACVSPLKDLLIPALSAGVWTQITLDMGVTSGCTAIVSIGAVMLVDKGAFVWHIDQVRATKGG